jgi:erythromycin esterase-like protein
VIGYLEKVDAEAARRARRLYGCFDHYGDEAQAYGYAAGAHPVVARRRPAGDISERDVIAARLE